MVKKSWAFSERLMYVQFVSCFQGCSVATVFIKKNFKNDLVKVEFPNKYFLVSLAKNSSLSESIYTFQVKFKTVYFDDNMA